MLTAGNVDAFVNDDTKPPAMLLIVRINKKRVTVNGDCFEDTS